MKDTINIILSFLIPFLISINDGFGQDSNWKPINNGLDGGSVFTIKAHPNGDIYAGTSNGIFVLRKNNETWEHLPDGIRKGRYNVTGICFTSNGNTYAVCGGWIYVLKSGQNVWSPINDDIFSPKDIESDSRDFLFVTDITGKIFKISYVNNKWSWEIVFDDKNYRPVDIYINSNDEIYVTTWKGLLYSKDNGNTWKKTLDNKELSCVIEDYENNIFCGSYGNSVYVSYDSCKTWENINSGLPLKGLSTPTDFGLDNNGNILVAVYSGFYRFNRDSQNWNRLDLDDDYISSITRSDNSIWVGGKGVGIYYSKDNGITWNPNNKGLKSHQVVAFEQLSNGELAIAAQCAGIYKSKNNGKTWYAAANNNLEDKQVLTLSELNNVLYTSTWNGGAYKSMDYGENWEYMDGHKFFCFSKTSDNLVFGGTCGRGIFKSEDNGNTWQVTSAPEGSLFAIFVDKDNIIYAGYANGWIYKSTDNGATWKQVFTVLNTQIYCLLVHSSGNIFAGTSGHGLYTSEDKGETWEKIEEIPDPAVSAIIEDKFGDIFLGAWGRIYKSENIGKTWERISETPDPWSLPEFVHIHDLNMNSEGKLQIATSGQGVYESANSFIRVPNNPILTYPSNNSTNKSLSETLRWLNQLDADYFNLEVSKDLSFVNPILSIQDLAKDSFEIKGLERATKYYWRVKGINSIGEGEWSETWCFTTKIFPFISNTGNNATIAIPSSATIEIDGIPISIGDQIGVFSQEGLCVGSMVWSGENMVLTIWGDNDQTNEKDGLSAGEEMTFHIWKNNTQTEYDSINVIFSQGNKNYTPNGIYIINSLINILPTIYVSEEISICSGEDYLGWTETGSYERTLNSVNGCDSVVTTYLTVNEVYEVTEDVSICQGENYKGWTTSDTYIENLESVNGCDSIVTTNLTFEDIYRVTEDIAICEGENYLGHTESGQFQRTLVATTGCDSIVTTNLIVNPTYEIVIDTTICEGESYKGWTSARSFTENLSTTSGCDSIVTTNLTVIPKIEIVENVSICKGESYNGWDTEGQYKESFDNVNGCDSTVITNLSIYPTYKPEISAIADTLKCLDTYQTYQWCDTNGDIINATDKQFVIEKSGEYHLVVTDDNGCTQTSNNIFVVKTDASIAENIDLKYSIIPNPNQGIFSFKLESIPKQKMSIKLVNSLGQTIEIRSVDETTEQFDVSHLSKGIYHLVISLNNYQSSEKIVVQ